jgi:hypothetical protein
MPRALTGRTLRSLAENTRPRRDAPGLAPWRRRRRGEGRGEGAETFEDLAKEYIERHAKKKRSGREVIVNGRRRSKGLPFAVRA